MAQGQIDYRIETPFPPAFAKLRTDYNEAVAQFRQITLSVAESADSINTGSNEISSAAEALSRPTEQKAAALEETAGASSEVTSGVRPTANRAENGRASWRKREWQCV